MNICENIAGKKIHFIGVGGIMMSALALELKRRGASVTGADREEGELVALLRSAGIGVTVGHFADSVTGADAVVRNAAIKDSSPDIVRARAAGIPIIERPQLLGEIMKSYERRICVSGTHGKSTTSSMLTSCLITAGREPTAFLGSVLPETKQSYALGGREFFIAESCEYCDSFLNLFPTTAVVLNVEADHLDYFSGIEQIKASFARFCALTPENGVIIVNGEDENALSAVSGVERKKVTFGLEKGDVTAKNLAFSAGYPEFDLVVSGESLGKAKLKVPGAHNVYNALACAAALHENGLPGGEILRGLCAFRGTLRRFEKKGEYNGAVIIDEYAHHPTELARALETAQAMGFARVLCVFQPHTYTRTRAFMGDFAAALRIADEAFVCDIFAAREEPVEGVTGEALASAAQCGYAGSVSDAAEIVKKTARRGDIVLFCGAGDIYRAAEKLTKGE